MKKINAQKKLEKAGYKLTYCIDGGIIAKPLFGGFSYQAETINGLVKKIFKKL